MSKPVRKTCIKCGDDKPLRDYYNSHSPMYAGDKKVPFCKPCLMDMVDLSNLEDSVQDILKQIDRPFITDMWESSLKEARRGGKSELGTYMKNIAMPQFSKMEWENSDSDLIGVTESAEARAEREVANLIREEDLTEDDLRNLEDKWGFGFEPQMLIYFQRKYDNLIGNYPQNTSLHREALMTYCVYKVRAEIATAEGDIREAKEWAILAQRQGEIAKININKLDKSDLSQGMDSFSELVAMVEKEVDIIPILPQFLERPHDKIDLAIYSFINYERRLHGLPDVEYSDIYDFYQKDLREYFEAETTNPDIKRHMKEIEIESKLNENGKKKILIYDVFAYINELKEERPDDAFIQNLDKWVEFVSWGKWNIDLFLDMVSPASGGITLDVDQRFVLRVLSRFKSVMCIFPRGFSKCVAGDSLLFTDEGMREIGEYFNYQDDGVETFTRHEIGLANRHGEIERSDKGVYSGYKKTKKVRTEEGYEVEGSYNHPLLTINKNEEFEWKSLEDFNVGDYIVINRKNDLWGSNDEVDVSEWSNELEAKRKIVPQSIMKSNKYIVSEYIKKLFNSVGIIDSGSYVFIVESERLSKQIQLILLNFGLISNRARISESEYAVGLEDLGVKNDYYYSRIKAIEGSKNHVYDLQMPDTQSFIANGIVNHNTFLNLLYNFHTSIFYPNMEIALTAQTQENASALVGEKWREIIRFFPIFEEEMKGNPKFSKDGAEVQFKSGGILNTLVNGTSSLGARRRRITVEEYAQVDDDVFTNCLEPIPNIPRMTVGKRGTINPYELNGQINYFSTSWFVG